MCIIVGGQQTKKRLFKLCPDASFKGLLHCTRATRTLAGCQAVTHSAFLTTLQYLVPIHSKSWNLWNPGFRQFFSFSAKI